MAFTHYPSWTSDSEMEYDLDADQAESEIGSTVSVVRHEFQKLAIQSPQLDEPDLVDADLMASPTREPGRGWLKRTRDEVMVTKGKTIVWGERGGDGRLGGRKRVRMSSVDLVDATEEDEAEEEMSPRKVSGIGFVISLSPTLTSHCYVLLLREVLAMGLSTAYPYIVGVYPSHYTRIHPVRCWFSLFCLLHTFSSRSLPSFCYYLQHTQLKLRPAPAYLYDRPSADSNIDSTSSSSQRSLHPTQQTLPRQSLPVRR
jgi:hypothetical protein